MATYGIQLSNIEKEWTKLMSDSIYLEARDIFNKYNGSYFQMEREGEYQKYKGFKVLQEIEAMWVTERKKYC